MPDSISSPRPLPLIGVRVETSPATGPAAPEPGSSAQTPADRLTRQLPQGKIPAKTTALEPAAFVSRQGQNFMLANQPFRFVGCNMYSLAREKPEVSEKMIADAAAEGFTVIRFWANTTNPERMNQLLDAGRKYHMHFIPVLANNGSFSAEMKAGDAFYRGGYKQDYLPYVEALAQNLQNRPEIMMWELVNEPQASDFNALFNFTQAVSTRLKQVDPQHLVSIGTIGGIGDQMGSQLSHFSTEPLRRLNSLPTLDAVSIHDYSYDATALERLDLLMRNQGNQTWSKVFGKADAVLNYLPRKLDETLLSHFKARLYQPWTVRGLWQNANQQDIQIARELNKPLYVGEAGYKKFHGEDRRTLFDLDMQHYFKAGASGYMLWSFQAQGRAVDGHDYGLGPQDGLAPLIRSWSQKLHTP